MMKNILFGMGLLISFSAFAQSWMPIEKTCTQHGDAVAEETLGMSIVEFEKLTDSAAMAQVKSKMGSQLYNSFIMLNSESYFLAEKIVRLNFLEQIKMFCNYVPLDSSLKNLLREAKDCSSKRFEINPDLKTAYSDYDDFYVEPDKKYTDVFVKIHDQLRAATKLPLNATMNNIVGAMSTMLPHGFDGSYVMFTQEVAKLAVDPKLRNVSGKLYFYLVDLILKAEEEQTVKGRDVFSDLVTFFRREGYSRLESRKLSFLYLGLFATRGASMFSTYSSIHPKPFSALFALSMSLSFLDKIAAKEGSNYTVPKQYSAKCRLGKPYHFWLAAFQTQFQKNQGHSGLLSYFLPVAGGIGYDFTITNNGRDIKKLFQIKTPYDSYANGTRLDNWARALGSHFGRHNGKPLPLDADELLIQTFKKGQMPSKIPTETNDMLTEYIRIVQPIPMILRLSL